MGQIFWLLACLLSAFTLPLCGGMIGFLWKVVSSYSSATASGFHGIPRDHLLFNFDIGKELASMMRRQARGMQEIFRGRAAQRAAYLGTRLFWNSTLGEAGGGEGGNSLRALRFKFIGVRRPVGADLRAARRHVHDPLMNAEYNSQPWHQRVQAARRSAPIGPWRHRLRIRKR